MSVNKTIDKLPEIAGGINNIVKGYKEFSREKACSILGSIHGDSLSGEYVDILRTFKGYKTPEMPEEQTDFDRSFFGNEIYPEQASEFFSEKMDFLFENGKQLTKILGEHIGCELPDVALFDSPGTLVQIDKEGKLKDSYYNFENILSDHSGNSRVSEIYDHNVLGRMAFEKAYFHYLIHLAPVGTPLSTEIIQKYLSILSGGTQYRGGYHSSTSGETFGNSASSLNEEVVASILKHFYPDMTIEDHCRKYDFDACNLLAGIGDECMSRMLALGDNKTELAIASLAKSIKRAHKSDTMGLLH